MKKITLFILTLIFTCNFLVAEDTSATTDSITSSIQKILSQTEQPAEERISQAFDILDKYHEDETEKIKICETIIQDFILHHFEDKEIKNKLMAKSHLLIYACYDQLQNNDSVEKHVNLALQFIEKTSFDSFEKGLTYQRFAEHQQRVGSIQMAHEYYWKAIKIYENMNAYLLNQSFCYYQLATGYYQMHDTEGMKKILSKMQLLLQQTSDKRLFYDYYSICSVYYTILSEDKPEEIQWMDSIIYSNLKSIEMIEKMSVEEMLIAQINPVWNYFNHAVYYDNEQNIDSIEKYLDKAEAAVMMMRYDGYSKTECDISIGDLRAWMLLYKGEYNKAEQQMLEVVQMLDTVDSYSPNTVIIEREQAYIFLVELYQQTGRLKEALHYQQLLNDLNKKRFDIEKNEALHELTVKYEVEKQDCEISRLTLENETTRKALWLTVGLMAFCVLAILFLVIILRLRRKNANQKIYEAALEAEIAQQELTHRTQEVALLQQEFDRLQELSAKNKETAEKYETDLKNLQQRLNDTPNKMLVLCVMDAVKNSCLESKIKLTYLEKLNNFNLEDAENIFLLAQQNLTVMDKKYIICFMSGMEILDLCNIFNVEPNSVYMVKYRIRKKFEKSMTLPF